MACSDCLSNHGPRADIEREYNDIGNRLGGDLSASAREKLGVKHNELKISLADVDKLTSWLQDENFPLDAMTVAGILAPNANPPVLVNVDWPEQPGVTLDNYKRLQKGMAYFQVIAILDSPGQGLDGESETITVYTCSGKDGDGSMNVTFKNDRLIAKSQST